jgi:hypothetical protein
VKRIVSLRDLASRLGEPLAVLREIAAAGDANYRVFKRRTKRGKDREFEVPNAFLMEIQRRIVKFLTSYPGSPAAYGAVKGRSTRANAERHLGQPTLATVDIEKFFPSVKHTAIFAMFRSDFGFGNDVASLLTRLTTFNYHLPQGAATSPALANALLAKPVDGPLLALAAKQGVSFTRYVDDFGFSGDDPTPLIQDTAKRLSPLGLKIDRGSKLKIVRRHKPQKITGLGVNSRRSASVDRHYRDRVRAAIHELPSLPASEQPRATASISGRILYIRQLNPGAGVRLQKKFEDACGRVATPPTASA